MLVTILTLCRTFVKGAKMNKKKVKISKSLVSLLLLTQVLVGLSMFGFSFGANAMLRHALRRTFVEMREVERLGINGRSLTQRFLSTRTAEPPAEESRPSHHDDVEREIAALTHSHNPTGERYRKPEPTKYVLYPEWDLASTGRSVSERFDVVTGVQSVPDVGVVGTLKKK